MVKKDGNVGRVYAVSVTFNRDGSDIAKASCTCPAFEEYGGICKHIIAAVLANQAERNREIIQREEMEKQSPATDY